MQKFRKLIGYGIGDFGLNIYWNTLSLWLIYWYTSVVGLRPEVAGTIFFIGMLWDAFSDPIVASISERVRTRHGTYRPFLLYGSFLLAACFVLLFWVPPFEGVTLLFVLVAIGIIFRTSYTLVAIPYSAMSARISYSSVERTELTGFRMFFAFVGLLAVSTLMPPLVRHFSGTGDYSAPGFQAVAFLGGGVATVALLACFFGTREKPVPSGRGDVSMVGLRAMLTVVANNEALKLLLGVIFLHSGATSALMMSMVFFIDANQPGFASKETVLTAFSIATLVGIPLWTVFIKRFNKKTTWTIASGVVAIHGISMWATGPFIVAGVPVQILGMGFAQGAFAVLLWSIIPDTVEYGQLATGKRSEGGVFGSVLTMQKLSGALMGFVIGWMLTGIGYDASLEVQTKQAASGLIAFLAICPSVLLFFSSWLTWLLPLDRKIHADIVDQLSRTQPPEGLSVVDTS